MGCTPFMVATVAEELFQLESDHGCLLTAAFAALSSAAGFAIRVHDSRRAVRIRSTGRRHRVRRQTPNENEEVPTMRRHTPSLNSALNTVGEEEVNIDVSMLSSLLPRHLQTTR